MRTILRCLAATIAIAIAGCATSSAAPPPAQNISAPLNLCAPSGSPPKEIAAQAGDVQYEVTVTDAAGNPVRGLKQSDFVAYVGNQSLAIKYFRDDQSGAPQSIVMVVDESGSMLRKLVVQDPSTLQSVRQELGEAAKRLNRCDEIAAIAVAGHPDKIRVIQPLTTDHALALGSITAQVPWGQTPLYDGINQGLELIESAHYPDRILVIITDGLDNSSETKLDEVLTRAKKDSVPIYMIGIGDPSLPPRAIEILLGSLVMRDRVDTNTLKALSVPSGGQYYVVSVLAKDDGRGLVAAIGEVADALGHSYAIGVIGPSTSASEEQPVKIGLANPGTFLLSARKVEAAANSGP